MENEYLEDLLGAAPATVAGNAIPVQGADRSGVGLGAGRVGLWGARQVRARGQIMEMKSGVGPAAVAGVFDEAAPHFVGIPAGRCFGSRYGRHSGGRYGGRSVAEAFADLIGIRCRYRVDEFMYGTDGFGHFAHTICTNSGLCPPKDFCF
jgi:hypothetical protein